ncbi:DNA-directed RNA polymerase sigma-70 factor [Segatella asaccharophila]
MNMSPKAFEIWVKKLRPQLLILSIQILGDKDEAEDVVQDTVLKLWSMRAQLDRYRSADALARVITRRLSLNAIRNRSHERIRQDIPIADSPEDRMIDTEEEERVMEMIRTLPDKQQTILRMKHIDGMEVSEIARTTGMTEEAVRQNLSRARRRIISLFNR